MDEKIYHFLDKDLCVFMKTSNIVSEVSWVTFFTPNYLQKYEHDQNMCEICSQGAPRRTEGKTRWGQQEDV